MMTDPHHLKVKIENNPLLAFTDRSLTEGGVATTCSTTLVVRIGGGVS